MCLGIVSACRVDPVVSLHLKKIADYRLPNFRSHGTKLGNLDFSEKLKVISGWLDNSEKEDVSGQLERLRGWSRGCTLPQEHCRLPPTYFWVTWHQTRAFLISTKNENLINGLWDNAEKETFLGSWSAYRVDPLVSLHLRNTTHYRLPTFGSPDTKLGHSSLELIIKIDFSAGLTILKKEMCLGIVSAGRVDPVVWLRLKKIADHRLPNFG